MFLQFVLILSPTIYVTSACTCRMMSWEAVMCPNNMTVVLARLNPNAVELYDSKGTYTTDTNSALQGRYQMSLTTIFKNGSFPLLEVGGDIFMVFPAQDNQCGQQFNEHMDLVIGGIVNAGGILASSTCYLLVEYGTIATNQRITDILLGNTELDCSNV